MQPGRHIVFIVRYSVLLPKQNAGWRIARDAVSIEEYANQLFDPGRLSAKLSSFEKVTLASLRSQSWTSDVKTWLLILTSDALPEGHFNELAALIESFGCSSPIIPEIVTVASPLDVVANLKPSGYRSLEEAFAGFTRKRSDQFRDGDLIATVRLDDDDALCSSFVQIVSELMAPSTTGFALSFPAGYEASFNQSTGQISNVRARYFPKIALGLSYVDEVKNGMAKSVMSLGNHTTVDERVPVVMDSRRPMYIRSRSEANDTGTPDFVSRLPLAPSLKDLEEHFAFVRVSDGDRYQREQGRNGFSWVREANLSETVFRLRGEVKQKAARIAKLERELVQVKSGGA